MDFFHGALIATQVAFGTPATNAAAFERPQLRQETAVVMPFSAAVKHIEAQGFNGLSHEDFCLPNPTATRVWENARILSHVVTSSPTLRENKELRRAIDSAAFNKKLYLQTAMELNEVRQVAIRSHSGATAEDIDKIQSRQTELEARLVNRARYVFRSVAALESMIDKSKIN